jgi:hypothetical protein
MKSNFRLNKEKVVLYCLTIPKGATHSFLLLLPIEIEDYLR